MDLNRFSYNTCTAADLERALDKETLFTAADAPDLTDRLRSLAEFQRSPLIAPRSDSDIAPLIRAINAANCGRLALESEESPIAIRSLGRFDVARLIARYSSEADAVERPWHIAYPYAQQVGAEMDIEDAVSLLEQDLSKMGDSAKGGVINSLIEKASEKIRRAISAIRPTESENVVIKDVPEEGYGALIPEIMAGGVTVVRGKLGTGKTEDLVNPVREQAAEDGLLPVHAVPKRSMISTAFANHPGNYSTVQLGEETYPGQLITVVNSLGFDRFCKYLNTGLLIIDEFSELLSHISGEACGEDIFEKARILAALEHVIKNAESVLICDAFIGDRELEYISAIRAGQITVYDDGKDYSEYAVKFDSKKGAPHLITDAGRALASGQNVVVFSDHSPKNTLKLRESICRAANQIKFEGEEEFVSMYDSASKFETLIIDKHYASTPEGQKLLSNIEAGVKNYQLVIVSPVICSGVSILSDHFHKGYVFSCGTVATRQAIQMMGRFRLLKDWGIGFTGRTHHRIRTERAEMFYNVADKYGASHVEGMDAENQSGVIRFLVEQGMADGADRMEWADRMMIGLQNLGFTVSRLDDEDDRKLGSQSVDSAAQTIKEMQRELIKSAAPISNDQAKAIAEDQARSWDDTCALEAYRIRSAYGIDGEIGDPVLDFDRSGIGRAQVRAIRTLSTEDAGSADDIIRKTLSQQFFSLIGISRSEGTWKGAFTAEQLDSVKEWLLSPMTFNTIDMTVRDVMMELFDGLRLAKPSRLAAKPSVAAILEQFGMKMERQGMISTRGEGGTISRSTKYGVKCQFQDWAKDPKRDLWPHWAEAIAEGKHVSELYLRQEEITLTGRIQAAALAGN